MKRLLIVAIYFMLFWVALPAAMIAGANLIDKAYFASSSLPDYLSPIGWLIISISSFTLIYAVFQFKKFGGEFPVSALPPSKLIEKGLFAVWRHPLYLFAFFIFTGCSFALRSLGFILIILPVFLVFAVIYIWVEERILVKRFGAKYILYRNRVPILFPKFINILRIVAMPFFNNRFRIKIVHPEFIPDSPPYFVVAAHRNYLDPFFISHALPHMVRHICTYEMFRGRVKSWFFKLIGAIPKRRFKTDIESNRAIINALNDGFPIGIFPDGGRSWTGEIRSLKMETLLLFRHFHHIPLLPVRLEGNYHSWPRWSDKMLKADLRVNIGKPFYVESKMEIAEIDTLVRDRIDHQSGISISGICRSRSRIGKLSIVLYRCPHCREMESLLEIPPDILECRTCKQKYILQPDFFLSEEKPLGNAARSIHSIYQQIKILYSDLNTFARQNKRSTYAFYLSEEEQLIYHSAGIYFVEKGTAFIPTWKGEVLLTDNRIIVSPGDAQLTLNLLDFDSVTIESNNKLQLYRNNTDELIQFTFDISSVLLWQDLLVLLIGNLSDKKVTTR